MDEIEKISKQIESYLNGDKEAINDIYQFGYRIAYDESYKTLRNTAQAEDVAQDVILNAIDKLDTLNNVNAFNGWIRKSAKNKSLDYIKKACSRNEILFSTKYNEENELEYDPSDEKAEIEYNEKLPNEIRNEVVASVLNHLSEEQKTITIMHFYDGMSLKEISEELGIEMSTVTGRFALAKKNIKKEVEEIQQRDDLKLYNISALPAIPFFMSLLGKFNPTDTTIQYITTKVINNKSIGKVVTTQASKKVAKATISTTAKTATGVSTATKAVIGVTVAATLATGTYVGVNKLNNNKETETNTPSNLTNIVKKKAEGETIQVNEMSVTVPEGWTYEEVKNEYDSNSGLKYIYLYDGTKEDYKTKVIIGCWEYSERVTVDWGYGYIENIESFDDVTIDGNTYEVVLNDTLNTIWDYEEMPYYSGNGDEKNLDLNIYRFTLQESKNSNYLGPYYDSDVDHDEWRDMNVEYQVACKSYDNQDILDNEDIKKILGSFKLNVIGHLKLISDSWEAALYMDDRYWVSTTGLYDVFGIEEVDGTKWYKVGPNVWIKEDDIESYTSIE